MGDERGYIGGAYVEVGADLTKFEQDLARSEAMVMQSTRRVEYAMANTRRELQQIEPVADEGSGGILGLIAHLIMFRKQARWAAKKGARALLAAINATTYGAIALQVAIGGLAAVAGGVLFVAWAAQIHVMRKVKERLADLAVAFMKLDGSTENARAFARQLERLPIIGGMVATAYRLVSRDAKEFDRAIMKLGNVTIKDNQIQLGLLARSLAEVQGFFADMVGMNNWAREIDNANKSLAEMNTQLGQQADLNTRLAGLQRRVGAPGENLAREVALSQLDGVERVRLEERHRHQDLMRFFEDERRTVNEIHTERLKAIQAEEDAGELSFEQAERRRNRLRWAVHQRLGTINDEQGKALAAAKKLAYQRMAAASMEQIEARPGKSDETLSALFGFAALKRRMASMTAAMRARAGGTDDLEVRRMEVDADYRNRIADTQEDFRILNQDAKVKMLKEQHAAALAEIDRQIEERKAKARERAAEEAEAEADERYRAEQERKRVESQIQQERLRQQGDFASAEREAIRQQMDERIADAERAGDMQLASLLKQQKQMLFAGVNPNRNREFQQVVRSRVALGGISGEEKDDKAVERQQLAEAKEQTELLRGMSQRDRVALLGR